MNREILKIKYDLNYILIAIRSTLEDFQLAYFLNKSSLFFLKRVKNDLAYMINENSVIFSTFSDNDDDGKKESFLIKNMSNYKTNTESDSLFSQQNITKTMYLIPELKSFDYLLKLEGVWSKKELSYIKKHIHLIKNIESEVEINLKKIKSVNNLVF